MPGGILSLDSQRATTPGTGIVWAAMSNAGSANHATQPGILRAYDASDITRELWNSQQNATRDGFGNFAKFVPPTVANGKVYMATFSQKVVVYGLLGVNPQLGADCQRGPGPDDYAAEHGLADGHSYRRREPGSSWKPDDTMDPCEWARPSDFQCTGSVSTAVTFTTAGVYTLQLTATDGAIASADTVVITVNAPTQSSLPPGWQTMDVGSVGIPGSATATNGTFTVQGAGADIWGSADAFRFAYYQLPGDGSIVARVATVQNVNVWTKAGVMIRQSLTAGSPHASMLVTPGRGLAFQRRRTAGATSLNTSIAGTAPKWVKLERAGQVVMASVSGDGATWTAVGQDTIALAGAVWVGLAVTSHDATRLGDGDGR